MTVLECDDIDFSDEAYAAASAITENDISNAVLNYRQMDRGISFSDEQMGIVRFLHDLCLVRSQYFEVAKPWVADLYVGYAAEFDRLTRVYS